MNDSWTPITRGKPVVNDNPHPQHSGLLQVVIPLSANPPREWQGFFDRPSGVSMSMSMHPPRLLGDKMHITPPDKDIEAYVRNVDARIAAANSMYEQHVLPSLRTAQDRAELDAAKTRRRIEEARRKARDL